jgi:type III secretory pathway component EscV
MTERDVTEPDSSTLERLHPGFLYTTARVMVFAACALVLFLIGFRSWMLVFGALLLSAPLSFFLLRKQREAFAKRVEGRMSKRQTEKARLRAALAGDDEQR